MNRISITLFCLMAAAACGSTDSPGQDSGPGPDCTIDDDCNSLDDSCSAGVCGADGTCSAAPANEGATCDDGAACTDGDTCAAGVCGGAAIDCSALDTTCTVGTCNAATGACEEDAANEGGSCDDGFACSDNDTCTAGLCGGSAVDCSGLADQCNAGVCDAATGACLVVAANEGGSCDDGDFCSELDICGGGTCAGSAVDCSGTDDQCNVGVCDGASGACVASPANEGFACDDGNLCSEFDTCVAGTCEASAVDCSGAGDQCNAGLCDAMTGGCFPTPANEGFACDDGNLCATGETCQTGSCTNATATDCSALNDQCAAGVCNPASGLCATAPANDGNACDDGDLCTTASTCGGGACGGSGSGGGTLFEEDFADNLAGWSLGPEWQIGPAMASPPASGNPDPDVDHTPTADDGVAGVLIGGNASTGLHPFYYLTSPVINLGGVASAHFSFWRWLNADYPDYMHSTVEVYDGVSWVVLFAVDPGVPVFDNAWMFQTYDVSAYANPNFQIRWGFDITSGGVFSVGQWNVDDVTITTSACDPVLGCSTGGSSTPVDCTALDDACNTGVCDSGTGGCVVVTNPDGTVCTDGAACTAGDVCIGGACMPGAAVDCSASADQCNAGLCDALTGACSSVPLANGTACNDGNAATCGDTCTTGVCGGIATSQYFGEDFSDNSAGWTLDTEWQIGAAVGSATPPAGNADPATDTSPTADNGVAGAILGGPGTITTALHGYYYLTSPVVNLAGVPGTVNLVYRRWLNSDYTPYMQNQVQVYNGTIWVTVWQSGGFPSIFDNAWGSHSFDVTAHKNANFRVRFGHTVGSSGAFTVTGWNLDDVSLGSPTCP